MARRPMTRCARRVLAGVLMGVLSLWVGFAAASGREVARRAEPRDGLRPAAGALQAAAGMAVDDDYVFLFKWGAQAPVGAFNYPYSVAVAVDGTVYVADTKNCRVQRFTSTGNFLRVWGSCGSGDGQFDGPSGVAVAADGTVYVADSDNYRIQRFTPTGEFLGKWGSEGAGDGQFDWPYGVAVAADGTVYVVDRLNHLIQRFTSKGEYLGEWGSEGTGDGQFWDPHGVAVAADGAVYVADTSNHRIQRFTSTGAYLGKWGSGGSGEGQFRWPYGVAVAADGTVYVADYRNDRIQRFTSTGGFLGKWGSGGSGDGQFRWPSGVAVAADGTVYVADYANDRIQRFTSTGGYLGTWGSRGSGDGQFYDPWGVAVASDGTIYVADAGNDRIQAFGVTYPDHWRGEYYANRWLAEAPSLIRQDAAIDFDWGSGSPGAGIPVDEFSVRWSQHVWFNSGSYRFELNVDDGVRFWVDGTLLVEEWWAGESADYEVSVDLGSGYNALQMEYCDTAGLAAARLSWELPDPRTISSPYTSSPPQIDGHFDEWPSYVDELVLNTNTADHKSPDEYIAQVDLSGSLRSQWDESYVYFAIHVSDDHLVTDSPSELWRDDVIQIGIDGNHNHERDWGLYSLDHQYTIRYDGTILDWLSSEGMEQVLHAERIVAGGYDVELAIPVSELSTDALAFGQVMGFNLQLQDDDDGGDWDHQLIWEGEDTTSCSGQYGHILFRESGPTTPTPTVTPSIAPSPTLAATPTSTVTPTLTLTPIATPTLTTTPVLLFLPTILKGFPAS